MSSATTPIDLPDRPENPLRLLVEQPSVVGQRHRPRRPGQEAGGKALLEQFHLAAQQSRRHAEVLRRAGKAAAFDDATEGVHDRELVHAPSKARSLRERNQQSVDRAEIPARRSPNGARSRSAIRRGRKAATGSPFPPAPARPDQVNTALDRPGAPSYP